MVDPGNRTVHVYALQDGAYQVRKLYTEQEIVQSTVFQDLHMPLNKLFSLENS
ncbi:Uma2 family endonuclease [Paenibacillus sp. CF384]|uniref:Uma2 family endonuclease n=1 Tax=Paenibacillus sp. CF384 TaxID=1884382 RepID=UPI00210DB808|nr:Uma2 family endonuclease [Paenibacillus sp. CF384]